MDSDAKLNNHGWLSHAATAQMAFHSTAGKVKGVVYSDVGGMLLHTNHSAACCLPHWGLYLQYLKGIHWQSRAKYEVRFYAQGSPYWSGMFSTCGHVQTNFCLCSHFLSWLIKAPYLCSPWAKRLLHDTTRWPQTSSFTHCPFKRMDSQMFLSWDLLLLL